MIRAAAALIVLVTLLAGTAGAADDARPRLADERILLRTNRGDLVLALYPDVAPRHVAQILALARLGVYDSTWFHRVDPTFVAQLTDAANRLHPLTPEQQSALHRIPAELSTTLRHRPGTLSMARYDDDLDSAESSFSILLEPAPHLDGKYTIFGELERGADVLRAIADAPRNGVTPVDRIVVEQAVVLTAGDVAQMEDLGELVGAIAGRVAGRPSRSRAHDRDERRRVPRSRALAAPTRGRLRAAYGADRRLPAATRARAAREPRAAPRGGRLLRAGRRLQADEPLRSRRALLTSRFGRRRSCDGGS